MLWYFAHTPNRVSIPTQVSTPSSNLLLGKQLYSNVLTVSRRYPDLHSWILQCSIPWHYDWSLEIFRKSAPEGSSGTPHNIECKHESSPRREKVLNELNLFAVLQLPLLSTDNVRNSLVATLLYQTPWLAKSLTAAQASA